MSEGTFGELSRFESHYDRYKNEPAIKLWKELALPGSGCQYDLGSHLVSNHFRSITRQLSEVEN